ncbi:uncharacterized protein B0H18DRAFT_1212717 [Fomitopsis serialis]|uniref:uncharacterized protein n=1 Tax=Fomitopsis serialis TaxID=139415 RepID=UPI0020085EC4|nr:uncharacterized protein B0H18DRAFT_1212717 [Neoantrodia serialis]KAH9922248.1 hypothetical protein B0H18DRAFT_1212717 [Neoantrodia serialis]
MLVLTPVSAFSSGYYPYPVVSPVSIQNDYLEAVALARAEAVHRLRQQELRRRQIEEHHRQAAFEAVYRQQVLRERQRRLAFARQREEAYVRALLEAREHERAEQLRLRRAREQQLLSAVSGFGSMVDFATEVVEPEKTTSQVPRASPQPSISQPSRVPSPVSSARERLQQRLERESDPDVRGAVEALLSVFLAKSQSPPVDRKGKGKAREEVPYQAPVASSSTTRGPPSSTSASPAPAVTSSRPTSGRSLKEALQQRVQNEEDLEIKESLNSLFTKLYGTPKAAPQPSTESATPSATTSAKFEDRAINERTQSNFSEASATGVPSHDGADLHRNSALPPSAAAKILALHRSRRARRTSLGAIQEIEDALHTLQASFAFPTQLDFSPSADSENQKQLGAQNGLMYTSNNRAVHSYEHALNALLERLDAVDSRGDLEVRGRRKDVVREVENALKEVERRVEESRERSREREGARTPLAEAPAAQEPEPVPAVDPSSQADATEDVPSPAVDPTPVTHNDAQESANDTTHTSDDVPENLPAPETLSNPSSFSQAPASHPSPRTVANLSYAASTLDLPVASVLSSPAASSVERPVPEAASEASQEQDATPVTEPTSPQPENVAASTEAHSSLVNTPSDSNTSVHTEEDKAETSSAAGSASSESGAFLLSSHPLQDPPRRSPFESLDREEPQVVTLAEAEPEVDNSSEWSEVEA